MSLSTGGVLPVLAQQWHTDLWRVHSGDIGGGEFPRIFSEVFWSTEHQGNNLKSLSSSNNKRTGDYVYPPRVVRLIR